jgi:hypothetical protein
VECGDRRVVDIKTGGCVLCLKRLPKPTKMMAISTLQVVARERRPKIALQIELNGVMEEVSSNWD